MIRTKPTTMPNLAREMKNRPDDLMRGVYTHRAERRWLQKMKKAYLFGGIAVLIVLSTVVGVYAHNANSSSEDDESYHYGYSVDDMNVMHKAMMSYIDDPELVDAMDQMHEYMWSDENMNRYGMMGALR